MTRPVAAHARPSLPPPLDHATEAATQAATALWVLKRAGVIRPDGGVDA